MTQVHSRKRATVSALHSSIEEDTSPNTDPGVCSGLYQDVLHLSDKEVASTSFTNKGIHWFPSERVDDLTVGMLVSTEVGGLTAAYLLRVEVLLAFSVFLK
jgi:hypothetical protein